MMVVPFRCGGITVTPTTQSDSTKFGTRGEKGALPKPLTQLKRIISSGLDQTTSLWAPITVAFEWVHQAAAILKNEADLDAEGVRKRFRGLLGAMTRWQTQAGDLRGGIEQFLKVTRSYWSGLFFCYDIPDFPRTNNDLEPVFGK